jgi:dihydroorotate dehydrogenase electron transfer subunit
LAERLSKRARAKSIAIIGAGTKSHVLCRHEFKKLGIRTETATEDGSLGIKGPATNLLRKLLKKKAGQESRRVYACGPNAMLREIAKITSNKRVRCELSLEEKMGCGTGVCLGCAVKTVSGIKLVCNDGPVFSAGDIIW